MFERLTWPLRTLAWKVEEAVLWPLGDLLRRGPKTPRLESSAARAEASAPETIEIAPELGRGPTGWPVSPASTAAAKATSADRGPLSRRFGAPIRETAIVLATIAIAAGVGVGVATLLGGSEGAPKTPSASPRPSSDQAAAAGAPSAASGPATLQGVSPDFKASQGSQAKGATAAGAQASPLAKTNSKPSSIPPGLADNVAAIKTARAFSGAFVFYEIGKTDAKVRKTFRATATPALARALEDRPPRLPDNANVPTATVKNIVLGTPQGKKLDASVSLLRLGSISELRLTMTRTKGGWAVSEVRG